DSMSNNGFFPTDQPKPADDKSTPYLNDVGQNFFQIYNIRIFSRRGFGSTNTSHSPLVAVINQALAKQAYPGIDPVGKTFHASNADGPIYQIVGVSADAKYANLRDDPPPTYYALYTQQKEESGMTYVIQSPLSSAAILPSIRSAMQEV